MPTWELARPVVLKNTRSPEATWLRSSDEPRWPICSVVRGEVHVGGALHHVADQAATVETGIGGVAAVAVGRADQRHRLDRDFLQSGAQVDHWLARAPRARTRLPRRQVRRRRRPAAARRRSLRGAAVRKASREKGEAGAAASFFLFGCRVTRPSAVQRLTRITSTALPAKLGVARAGADLHGLRLTLVRSPRYCSCLRAHVSGSEDAAGLESGHLLSIVHGELDINF